MIATRFVVIKSVCWALQARSRHGSIRAEASNARIKVLFC
jgi:hypothetical protein